MKTKTTSNPGPLSRALFTSFLVIVAAGLSVGTAWTAHAQENDLFASVNIGGTCNVNGGSSIFRYDPAGPPPSIFASNLRAPRGLAFDSAGNLFVATNSPDDSCNAQGTIFKITPDGLMSTFATGFPVAFVQGLAADSVGSLFLTSQASSNTEPSNVYKITPNGTLSPFGTVSYAGWGVAIDINDNVYVATSGAAAYQADGHIIRFAPDGTPDSVPYADHAEFPSTEVGLKSGPIGMAFDSSGNLFVSTGNANGNGDIYKFPSDYPTNPKSVFATGLVGSPRGLAFDSADNLYVAAPGVSAPGNILQFTPPGEKTVFASGIGAAGNRGPEFLAFAPPNTSIAPNVTMAVTLTFPEGTGPETTTVTLNPNPSPTPSPSEFQLGNPPLAFNITANPTPTTAPIIIAFQVPQSFLDQCGCDVSTLRVLHGPALEDVTCPVPNPGPTPDPTTNTVYASVSSLSPFVIAKLRFKAQVQQPVNSDGTSVFNVRRGVVPVKFTLTHDGAATCALPAATIALTRTSGDTTGAIEESVYSGSADTGSNFRINSCQYVYNLSASALGVGTYRADIKINGTIVGNAIFQLK